MANTVLVGAQWGDEGKGKIIDVLTERADWVVRFQGGSNAGHTVEIGSEKYVLHLLPSGILHPGRKCVIANGVVIDLTALQKEISSLAERGVDPAGRLFISDRAHIVLPYHRAVDGAREQREDHNRKIGTTQRGIGPAYADKITRTGLRICDLRRDDFERELRHHIRENNRQLETLGAAPLDEEEAVTTTLQAAESIRPFIADTAVLINQAIGRGEQVLFEGAQGIMLDVDHGTYPYVTSSNASSGGACAGTGVPPNRIDRVIGVIKAYTTRVGEGPFPTELADADGQRLRDMGNEYGATTGRPRRCGWFDAVVARHAAMINGVDTWAMMKLDVLDTLETIKICVAYELDGQRLETIPASAEVLARCRPLYEEWPGWQTPTAQARTWDELPDHARTYLKRLEELCGAPLGMLSVGPRRDSTILLDPLLGARHPAEGAS